jgi:hypothetical protein
MTMELLIALVAAVGGGGAIFAGRRLRSRREEREEALKELETVRALADEDVTLLGEELRKMDARLEGAELDEDAREDLQTALDAYESAGRTVSRMAASDEVSHVADTLASGRYALACVRARVAGQPLPTKRTPCFFNPQHGPAATEVMWRARGRGTRTVPACAQDAARVAAGERPDVREVRVNGRKVAYWEAGAALAPYVEGYFVGSAALNYAIMESHGALSGMFGNADQALISTGDFFSAGALGDFNGNQS